MASDEERVGSLFASGSSEDGDDVSDVRAVSSLPTCQSQGSKAFSNGHDGGNLDSQATSELLHENMRLKAELEQLRLCRAGVADFSQLTLQDSHQQLAVHSGPLSPVFAQRRRKSSLNSVDSVPSVNTRYRAILQDIASPTPSSAAIDSPRSGSDLESISSRRESWSATSLHQDGSSSLSPRDPTRSVSPALGILDSPRRRSSRRSTLTALDERAPLEDIDGLSDDDLRSCSTVGNVAKPRRRMSSNQWLESPTSKDANARVALQSLPRIDLSACRSPNEIEACAPQTRSSPLSTDDDEQLRAKALEFLDAFGGSLPSSPGTVSPLSSGLYDASCAAFDLSLGRQEAPASHATEQQWSQRLSTLVARFPRLGHSCCEVVLQECEGHAGRAAILLQQAEAAADAVGAPCPADADVCSKSARRTPAEGGLSKVANRRQRQQHGLASELSPITTCRALQHVRFSMTLQNMSCDALLADDELLAMFTTSVCTAIVQEVGEGLVLEDIAVDISSSQSQTMEERLMVLVSIFPDSYDVFADTVQAVKTSTSLARNVVAQVRSVPNIGSAMLGTVSMSYLSGPVTEACMPHGLMTLAGFLADDSIQVEESESEAHSDLDFEENDDMNEREQFMHASQSAYEDILGKSVMEGMLSSSGQDVSWRSLFIDGNLDLEADCLDAVASINGSRVGSRDASPESASARFTNPSHTPSSSSRASPTTSPLCHKATAMGSPSWQSTAASSTGTRSPGSPAFSSIRPQLKSLQRKYAEAVQSAWAMQDIRRSSALSGVRLRKMDEENVLRSEQTRLELELKSKRRSEATFQPRITPRASLVNRDHMKGFLESSQKVIHKPSSGVALYGTKIAKRNAEIRVQEEKDLTFKPDLSLTAGKATRIPRSSAGLGPPPSPPSTIKAQNLAKAKEQSEAKAMEECTFRPRIKRFPLKGVPPSMESDGHWPERLYQNGMRASLRSPETPRATGYGAPSPSPDVSRKAVGMQRAAAWLATSRVAIDQGIVRPYVPAAAHRRRTPTPVALEAAQLEEVMDVLHRATSAATKQLVNADSAGQLRPAAKAAFLLCARLGRLKQEDETWSQADSTDDTESPSEAADAAKCAEVTPVKATPKRRAAAALPKTTWEQSTVAKILKEAKPTKACLQRSEDLDLVATSDFQIATVLGSIDEAAPAETSSSTSQPGATASAARWGRPSRRSVELPQAPSEAADAAKGAEAAPVKASPKRAAAAALLKGLRSGAVAKIVDNIGAEFVQAPSEPADAAKGADAAPAKAAPKRPAAAALLEGLKSGAIAKIVDNMGAEPSKAASGLSAVPEGDESLEAALRPLTRSDTRDSQAADMAELADMMPSDGNWAD